MAFCTEKGCSEAKNKALCQTTLIFAVLCKSVQTNSATEQLMITCKVMSMLWHLITANKFWWIRQPVGGRAVSVYTTVLTSWLYNYETLLLFM